jgi:hypothetical protein
MYPTVEHAMQRNSELVAQTQRQSQLARLRALRRASRRVDRAAERLNRAREESKQLRNALDTMS